MPAIKGYKSETQDISGSDRTWTVAAGAVIRAGEIGIFEDFQSGGNVLKIMGAVFGVPTMAMPAATAVFTQGDAIRIEIGNSAYLSGRNGASAYGDDATIANAGTIIADGGLGIQINNFGGGGTVVNRGLVDAGTGVYLLASGASVTNEKGGRILADETGVEMLATGEGSRLTNHGTIIAFAEGGHAILCNDGDDRIVNSGTIRGAIDLGGGADVFDFRGGSLDGVVAGGEGDDTLITRKGSVVLSEQGDDGFDTVKSTVSYALGDNVEQLTLLGRKKADGTGSADDNWLYGNAGANRLLGMGGADYLSGGKGKDVLTGGEGADIFVLGRKSGRDTVTDFVDGEDFIRVAGFSGIGDPSDLEGHVKQKGDDVWIAMGKDVLVLKDIDVSLIDGADFVFDV